MENAPPSYPAIVDYDEHAKHCARDDFWGQIKRTVNGKPVPESHIDMIVDAIRRGLAPQPGDVLLDLACGNGALTQRLSDACAALVGVDRAAYLIEIANEFFAAPPARTFIVNDVVGYLGSEPRPEQFTKVLCYGSFADFSEVDARASLALLHARFTRVQSVFIGNLPDRDRAHLFYTKRAPVAGELDDHMAQIGIWRTQAEFAAMAAEAGWDATFSTMPQGFFSAHYRYDALLRRRDTRV